MAVLSGKNIAEYLQNFSLKENDLFGSSPRGTSTDSITIGETKISLFRNEFWTSKQRQASSIHEISYRACFKPQLPRFFIELLTGEGDLIYDPFSGRGTTVLEAGLLGRRIISNDVNPLSRILTYPRFFIPRLEDIKIRLEAIEVHPDEEPDVDLSMFYHPKTEAEIRSLRRYLQARKKSGEEDSVDRWIRMVATNRLTGHSKGFFSVYTLPPNQAVSARRQHKINRMRNQQPAYRDVKKIILHKSGSLLRNLSIEQNKNLYSVGKTAIFTETDASKTPEIKSGSVRLTVTSPPFLNVVQYAADNWLRCWFNRIDTEEISQKITMSRNVKKWAGVMQDVFRELYRITTADGWVAFEVGEVKKKSIRLDEVVVPLGEAAGFSCEAILINTQQFTKTANIWGIENNEKGTNTNRIVLFRK